MPDHARSPVSVQARQRRPRHPAAAAKPDRVAAPLAAAKAANRALLQFLDEQALGVAQVGLDGEVHTLNERAAYWLQGLAGGGPPLPCNLFEVLAPMAPQLPALVAAAPLNSVVCTGLRLPVAAPGPPLVLGLGLLKLDGARLVATLCDATVEVLRDRHGPGTGLLDAHLTDPLTQLPNRVALLEYLDEALGREAGDAGHGFAVMFINCDRFKQINDSHGHSTGDAVLCMMAERLRTALRQRERAMLDGTLADMVARVGSDEFAVMLDLRARPDDVHAVAQRLLRVLAQPFGVDLLQLHCGVSLGLVLRAQAAVRSDVVLQDASIAMVEAKRAGGARYAVFEPAMRERAACRAAIENELRDALGEGQLFVLYQPVVGLLADGGVDRAVGVEALVRWRHPRRGVVPPLEFIGVAEECGLIGALGDYVLATACSQFMAWQRQLGTRAPRQLAVNLSRAQLEDAAWLASVQATLAGTGMPARQLQLEVTESLAGQDDTVRQRLHGLKALNVGLALDDFGTGYSSLASLHQLPVDTVKIDRSFVEQAHTSEHHRVLIEATVRVATSLGMQTVAEGIETAAQAAVIRALGCDKGQGFLFSRPLSSEDLVSWLAASDGGC